MGKRRGGKKRVSGGKVHTTLTLREEASGKSRPKDVKSMLKLKHLQRLAEWSAGEASIPSLGAFFGHRFADFGESLGLPPDRSLFPCQRCETLLRPSFNCDVRIEKNRSKKGRHGNKTKPPTQNNVVYTCNFCSHRNIKPGTPRGYVRQLAPPKEKPCREPKAGDSTPAQEHHDTKKSEANKPETPPTPLGTTGVKLLESKRRVRKKSGLKGSTDEALVRSAPAEAEKAGGTSRKRRKGWLSLKEDAANEEHERNKRFRNISIPFNM